MSTSHFALHPNTTITRYSLAVDAFDRAMAALEDWRAAGAAYIKEHNTFTEARLWEATKLKNQAEADYKTVTGKVFPAQTEDTNVPAS